MTEEFIKIIKGEICPYCKCETQLVGGEIIYPNKTNEIPKPNYLNKKYYQCINNPDHYVGTYSNNKKSLGRIADCELRKLKHTGHGVFDPLWNELRIFKNQKEAYKWLSNEMNIPIEYTHFGMFTNEQCLSAIQLCYKIKNSNEAAI